jgi:hypothetical protein
VLLSGVTPIVSAGPAGARYLGSGDVVRDASLRFASGSRVEVHALLERCAIDIAEGTELVIGEDGVLADCTVTGAGRIIVHGKFFEGATPGIVGPREIVVRSRGVLVSAVRQRGVPARFAFEPGSRLRTKISKIEAIE